MLTEAIVLCAYLQTVRLLDSPEYFDLWIWYDVIVRMNHTKMCYLPILTKNQLGFISNPKTAVTNSLLLQR